MKKKRDNTLMNSRINSFSNAIRGLATVARNELNFRIHLVAFLIVIITGIALKISANDWIAILIVSFVVLICEAFNTAVELLCDYISPQQNKTIGLIKDISAGSVLLSAILAIITGLIVFIPKIL